MNVEQRKKKRIKCDKEEKPKKQKSKNLAKLRGQKNLYRKIKMKIEKLIIANINR